MGGELHTFGSFPIGGHFLGEKIICSYLVFLAVLIKNGHICVDIHVYVIGATFFGKQPTG